MNSTDLRPLDSFEERLSSGLDHLASTTPTCDPGLFDPTTVPLAISESGGRRTGAYFAAAAAVAAATVTGLIAISPGDDEVPARADQTALDEPLSTSPAPGPSTDRPAPVSPEPSVVDTTPVPLPDGAVLNGVVPDCTATTDEAVFECSVAAFPEPLDTLDYTGYVTYIVDDMSRVSGGCRATNSDATEYLCFIGERAVDEGTIGENLLGDEVPREYAAG